MVQVCIPGIQSKNALLCYSTTLERTKPPLITIKLHQIHTSGGMLQNHSPYSGIPQTGIQKASGNICNCSSTVYFQSMSEHKRRIKFLALPPPPPSCRDDTANRIKWVTGLYDHYIKVVHMQNPQNMEKKIIKEVAPSVCGEKNNSWCKELQDASLASDKMGNDRKQLFTLLTAKETYSPCSRVWKPPDAALFSHFHIFVHATSESFSIFTEGGEESTKPSNVYIFFFLCERMLNEF